MNCRRQRANRADGSNVEDAAGALPDHLLVDRFGYREETPDVRADYFIPRTIGCRRKIIAAINGCVINEDVDAAPFLDQFAGQMLKAESVCDRNLERAGASSQRLDDAFDFIREIVSRVIVERDIRAFARKHLTKRGANAARAAGDECAFSFE